MWLKICFFYLVFEMLVLNKKTNTIITTIKLLTTTLRVRENGIEKMRCNYTSNMISSCVDDWQIFMRKRSWLDDSPVTVNNGQKTKSRKTLFFSCVFFQKSSYHKFLIKQRRFCHICISSSIKVLWSDRFYVLSRYQSFSNWKITSSSHLRHSKEMFFWDHIDQVRHLKC